MTIRVAAIGFAHNHIFNQLNALIGAGAELVNYYDTNPDRIALFLERYPDTPQAPSIEAILEDESIDVVVSASIPKDRAPLGIRVMQHDKDFLCAKPAFTSIEHLEEARRLHQETGRKYIVFFGERIDNPSTIKAGELVHSGAVGQVVQTVGFGPHRLLGHVQREEWVFDDKNFGGVINDLASHQMDQFLYFTGSTEAELVASHIGNFKFSQFPKMHDFGDVIVRSPHATGYIRVDWLTPKGLNSWGDVRLFILGTDGYIELRKNTDIAGREGNNHLFLVDNDGMQYIDCKNVQKPFGQQFINDVVNRTETAMTQAHCFLASQLSLEAELQAVDLT